MLAAISSSSFDGYRYTLASDKSRAATLSCVSIILMLCSEIPYMYSIRYFELSCMGSTSPVFAGIRYRGPGRLNKVLAYA